MDEMNNDMQVSQPIAQKDQKFCKHCGERIDVDCVVCPKCGKQVELLKQETQQPQVIINNSNNNTNTNTNTNINRNTNSHGYYPYKSKMVALLLSIFLGWLGVHRFYVGKVGTGILWALSGGLCGIGWLVDIIMILVGSFRDKAGMPLK